jgi:purine-cytosine permease-like protein
MVGFIFVVSSSFNIIGALPPALMATLGPKLGLRTMTIQRYSFGMLQNESVME